MKKIIIFGAGIYSKLVVKNELKNGSNIVAIIDNNKEKQGKTYKISDDFGINIYSVDILNTIKYDKIIISTFTGYNEVMEQLLSIGIDKDKIDASFVELSIKAREAFCYDFANFAKEEKLIGDVAEVGVFRGDFAKHINKAFCDKKLYLFDTFNGFDESELKNDPVYKKAQNINSKHLSNTSEELVMNKMPFKKNCFIKKGLFPASAAGLENNQFLFTNLDCDLYEPTLAGLKFFIPRTVKGGVVLIHDYLFSDEHYIGIKKAVNEFKVFAKKNNIKLIFSPIGDAMSLAIFKA